MTAQQSSPSVELKILTSNSTNGVLAGLVPAFERASGCKVAVSADPAKTMMERIKGGERGDVAVLLAHAIDELAGLGIVTAASCRPFASSRIGIAVLKGAPRPDIRTVDALRRALLNAKSIAHTVHGASGMYVPTLLERLGIAGEMKAKTVTRPGGLIGKVVAAGEAELAIQQISELVAVPGIELVGPLPAEVNKTYQTSAGIFADSKHPAEAEALLTHLLAPASAAVFAAKGLDKQ